MGVLSTLADVMSDLAVWLITGVVGALTFPARVIWYNRQRTKQHEAVLDIEDGESERLKTVEEDVERIHESLDRQERYWTGDPEDPSYPGALQDLHDIKEELDVDDE
jgi:hypothetical protein